MERIERSLELPKLNATVVARKQDNLSFLDAILFEKESADKNTKNKIGWYLYLKDSGPSKRYFAASTELEPNEVQYLENILMKALNKLIVLEKVKISGLYSFYLDGINNLCLEVKGDGENAWLEYTFSSPASRKFITRLNKAEVFIVLQKLEAAQALGETLVKELESIEALSQSILIQEKTTKIPSGVELTKYLENLVKKTKKIRS